MTDGIALVSMAEIRLEQDLIRLPCNAPAQHIQKSAHFADSKSCKHFGW